MQMSTAVSRVQSQDVDCDGPSVGHYVCSKSKTSMSGGPGPGNPVSSRFETSLAVAHVQATLSLSEQRRPLRRPVSRSQCLFQIEDVDEGWPCAGIPVTSRFETSTAVIREHITLSGLDPISRLALARVQAILCLPATKYEHAQSSIVHN